MTERRAEGSFYVPLKVNQPIAWVLFDLVTVIAAVYEVYLLTGKLRAYDSG